MITKPVENTKKRYWEGKGNPEGIGTAGQHNVAVVKVRS
jgi:hypothetical protein